MRYETAQTNRLGNRQTNQDRTLVIGDGTSVLMVVADGMGGHARGELAAQMLVDTFERAFNRTRKPILDPYGFLQRVIERAHDYIVRAGAEHEPPIDPRTTCVACLVQDGVAYWAHVGDSRLYIFRRGTLMLRTRDHTYVESLYQQGEITEDEALTHPMRHYVTECVGGHGPRPFISTGAQTALARDDVVLLCSDGLWGALGEMRISALLDEHPLEAALDAMSAEAERESYPNADNVSLVAVRCLELADEAPVDETAPEEPAAPAPAADPIQSAIAEINRALDEYGHEMGELAARKRNRP